MKIIKSFIILIVISSSVFGQINNLKTHAQMDVDCKNVIFAIHQQKQIHA